MYQKINDVAYILRSLKSKLSDGIELLSSFEIVWVCMHLIINIYFMIDIDLTSLDKKKKKLTKYHMPKSIASVQREQMPSAQKNSKVSKCRST